MSDRKNAEEILRLAELAVAQAGGAGADAAVMLIDAAVAIALTRFGSRANEIAGHLAEYIVRQVNHVSGEAGNA